MISKEIYSFIRKFRSRYNCCPQRVRQKGPKTKLPGVNSSLTAVRSLEDGLEKVNPYRLCHWRRDDGDITGFSWPEYLLDPGNGRSALDQ